VYAEIEGNPKLGSAGAPPPGGGGVADPQKYASPHVSFCQIWSMYVQNYERY